MTALVCLLALSVSAGTAQGAASKRWLPLLEISRFFRPALRTVYVSAPGLSTETAEALRRASESNGLEVELAFPQPDDAPAAIPLPRLDETGHIVGLVLPEGADWDEAASALAASGAYGPTTLLALSGSGRSPGARAAMFQAARKHDMAAVDIRGTSPADAGVALAEALVAIRGPHPVLLALPLLPLISVALLWLRHRSRHPKNR